MCTEQDTSGAASNETALIAALASIADGIAQTLSGVDEEAAHRQPLPGEWCIVETLVHLGDVEPRYRARLERIASEDAPEVPAIWPARCPTHCRCWLMRWQGSVMSELKQWFSYLPWHPKRGSDRRITPL